jgi:glycosyltransferase involved in cell wall biosynthesis
MKVSVIIPAYNEEKLLAATLTSVRAAARSFAALGWAAEFIVCDNNSTDATAAVARENGAQVVFEPVNQIARARNTGARAATGDWIVFVDADSRPTAELFAEAAEWIQSGRCLAGGSVVRLDERHFVADAGTGLWNLISRVCHWFAGSFSFCETRAFREVGGFNEELFASEELDLSQRLNKLARREGKKKVVILYRHPLLTSARKMSLYSRMELLRFMGRAFFRPRRTVTSRDACSPWYDGRR